MGFKALQSAAFAIGRVAGMSLLMLTRNNFISHEERITNLEDSPAVFPVGSIHIYAGTAPFPTGFLLCDGSAVSRTTYADLFAIFGTSYNIGGEAGTDFRLPDYRGRSLVGSGAGSGLTARTIGATGGSETHTLVTGEMAQHTHTVTDPGHTHLVPNQEDDSVGGLPDKFGDINSIANGGPNADLTTASSTLTSLSAGNAGSGGAHNNMQPCIVVNFIVKT